MSIINNHLSIIRGEVLFLNAMKKSKSYLSYLEQSRKIGQLIQKVGRTPDKAGQYCCRVVETKTWRTNHVWSTSFVENASRPNPSALSASSAVIKNNGVNQCKSVKSVVNSPSRLSAFVAETQLVRRSLGEGGSIKIERLCKTKPISEKVKCL